MSGFIPLWPVAASANARHVDLLFLAFSALTIALTLPVFVLIVAFAIKYRRGRTADRREHDKESRDILIEASWAAIPFLLTLAFFAYATVLFAQEHRPPADAMVVNAVGKQWMWKFEHPGGQAEINELHVPVRQDVRIVMTSQDVIHSLYVPALRLKQDVLPGRYTTLWFKADETGDYPLRCAEFCGFDHSGMVGRLVVQRPEDYARWLATSQTDGTLAAQGAALFRGLGCGGCHEAAPTALAPSLAGLYGRPAPLADGRVVPADEQYLRDSVLDPNKEIAAGYAAVMPSFKGQVSEDEMIRLVAYMKSLAAPEARP